MLTSPAGSASFIEFEPGERPMQLFHMPDEEGTQWQAAFHDFGYFPGQFMARRFDITSAPSHLARPLSKSGSASIARVTSGWRANPVTIW